METRGQHLVSSSIFFSETRPLLEPGAHPFSRAGWPESILNPPVSNPSTGLTHWMHTTSLSFHSSTQDLISGPHICDSTLPTELPPQLHKAIQQRGLKTEK